MKALEVGLVIIFAVIGVTLGLTAWLQQAPTVATLTNTATGTSLANAGITGNTLAGQVYSFVNPIYAVGGLLIVAGIGFAAFAKKEGYF